MEAAVEAELVPVTQVGIAVGTTRATIEVANAHLVAARAEPLLHEIGVDMGTEHLGDRRVDRPRCARGERGDRR